MTISIACNVFSLDLHANIIVAPNFAKILAVTKPMPVFDPVIMIILVDKSAWVIMHFPPLKNFLPKIIKIIIIGILIA